MTSLSLSTGREEAFRQRRLKRSRKRATGTTGRSESGTTGRPPGPVKALPGLLDQPAPERLGHRSGPVRRPQLLEDVLEVRLHRIRGDEQLVRDVLVGVTEGQ